MRFINEPISPKVNFLNMPFYDNDHQNNRWTKQLINKNSQNGYLGLFFVFPFSGEEIHKNDIGRQNWKEG